MVSKGAKASGQVWELKYAVIKMDTSVLNVKWTLALGCRHCYLLSAVFSNQQPVIQDVLKKQGELVCDTFRKIQDIHT